MTDHQGLTDGGFVEAGTPESEALHVEGSYFAAHHIGGTTWRFGSGDEAKDDQIGTITLAPHGYTEYGLASARWIVNALDQVKRQAKEDERRRIVDELDGLLDAPDPSNAGTIGTQFDELKVGLGNFIDRLEAATQSTPKGSAE